METDSNNDYFKLETSKNRRLLKNLDVFVGYFGVLTLKFYSRYNTIIIRLQKPLQI